MEGIDLPPPLEDDTLFFGEVDGHGDSVGVVVVVAHERWPRGKIALRKSESPRADFAKPHAKDYSA